MRVLMFGWEFPPHISGGLGTACYGLTKALAKIGTEILFVVPKAYGDEDETYARVVNASDIKVDIKTRKLISRWKNFTVIEAGANLIPYMPPEEFERMSERSERDNLYSENSVFTDDFKFSGKYGKNLMQEVARYAVIGAAIAKKYDFDVIHAHDWLTYQAGIAAKELSGKPLVIHVHATEYDRSGENVNPAVFPIEKKGMEAADRVITVSNLTKNIVVDRYGIDEKKVFTVHNGVEPVQYDIINTREKHVKEKIVTFLGRITFQKGPEYFVEVANKVLKKTRNVRFVMAGSGDMLHKMIKRAAKLKICDRFHFTGFLKGEDVYRMFSMSDVYVMPSVSEPFGISPLEALRSNVPVIISKQSGVAETLNHAVKTDFWDVDAMADAIYGIINYPALSKMFLRYGKTEVENLKWDNAARKTIDVYNSAVFNID